MSRNARIASVIAIVFGFAFGYVAATWKMTWTEPAVAQTDHAVANAENEKPAGDPEELCPCLADSTDEAASAGDATGANGDSSKNIKPVAKPVAAQTLLAQATPGGPAIGQSPVADPLPSWNEGPAKQAIVDFVAKVTKQGGPDFVPVPERIAIFDNDGTLWCEQPVYVQVVFALDRVKELAPQHPEWKTTEPFKSILADDKQAMFKFSIQDFEKVVAVSLAGMTVEEFQAEVKKWLATHEQPRFHRRYTDLAYQPMLELLAYCARANSKPTSSPAAVRNLYACLPIRCTVCRQSK